MLVYYSVKEKGCFGDYSDATPCDRTMRDNGITTFTLRISQCITFNKTKKNTETLISAASFKSLYSRLVFKFIKGFAKSPRFEKACKRFYYESGKSKEWQKQTCGLQCHLTIPRIVTILNNNQIDLN